MYSGYVYVGNLMIAKQKCKSFIHVISVMKQITLAILISRINIELLSKFPLSMSIEGKPIYVDL